MPPATVYRPVRTTTATEPIQKLLKTANPKLAKFRSGSSVANTTPPAKMPTAIFVNT